MATQSNEGLDAQDESQPPSLERKLQEEDIPQLLDILQPFSTKWFSIGIQLQIPKHILCQIEADHRGDTERQLIEMIDTWIKRGRNCYRGALIKALDSLGYCEDPLQNARQQMKLVKTEKLQVNEQKLQLVEDLSGCRRVNNNLDDLTGCVLRARPSERPSERQLNDTVKKLEDLLQKYDAYFQDIKRWKEQTKEVEGIVRGSKQLMEWHLDSLEADQRQFADNGEENKMTTIIKDVKSNIERCTNTLQVISEHCGPSSYEHCYCKNEIQEVITDLERTNRLLVAIGKPPTSEEDRAFITGILVGAGTTAIVASIGYGTGRKNAMHISLLAGVGLGLAVGLSISTMTRTREDDGYQSDESFLLHLLLFLREPVLTPLFSIFGGASLIEEKFGVPTTLPAAIMLVMGLLWRSAKPWSLWRLRSATTAKTKELIEISNRHQETMKQFLLEF